MCSPSSATLFCALEQILRSFSHGPCDFTHFHQLKKGLLLTHKAVDETDA